MPSGGLSVYQDTHPPSGDIILLCKIEMLIVYCIIFVKIVLVKDDSIKCIKSKFVGWVMVFLGICWSNEVLNINTNLTFVMPFDTLLLASYTC